jgi:hypothetical protein
MCLGAVKGEARERVYYFHNDHLGTPQVMTDQAGRVVWQAEYDVFGKAAVNEDPDGDGKAVTNNLRFPGQYYDAETGLHYNWNRYHRARGRVGLVQLRRGQSSQLERSHRRDGYRSGPCSCGDWLRCWLLLSNVPG